MRVTTGGAGAVAAAQTGGTLNPGPRVATASETKPTRRTARCSLALRRLRNRADLFARHAHSDARREIESGRDRLGRTRLTLGEADAQDPSTFRGRSAVGEPGAAVQMNVDHVQRAVGCERDAEGVVAVWGGAGVRKSFAGGA